MINSYLIKPGAEFRLKAESRQGLIGFDKYFLGQIVSCFMIVNDINGQAKNLILIVSDQHREGFLVSLLGQFNYFIFFHCLIIFSPINLDEIFAFFFPEKALLFKLLFSAMVTRIDIFIISPGVCHF